MTSAQIMVVGVTLGKQPAPDLATRTGRPAGEEAVEPVVSERITMPPRRPGWSG